MPMSSSRTILLLNVRRTLPVEADSGFDFLGLFYLAAVLESRGYDPWVFHGGAHEVPDLLKRKIARRGIAAVGFTCDFENVSTVTELSQFVRKNYGVPVIVGGPQAIALKKPFFDRSGCDAVVRGEGEETVIEVLDHFVNHQRSLSEIQGVTWMDDTGSIHVNPSRPPIADPDTLPYPAFHRSLHPEREYGQAVFTGRGCPYACAFCYQSTGNRRVRFRAVEKVLDEIRTNLERNPHIRYLTVLDDTFTLNPSRLESFCEGITELRKEHDFVWYCEGHVANLARHPEMLAMMTTAGLARLQIGVESGSQQVLDTYRKHTTIHQIEKVVGDSCEAGVPQIACNFIMGGAQETDDVVTETMLFAERLLRMAPGAIDILTGFLRPYPGTAITEDPDAFGLDLLDQEATSSCDDYPVFLPRGLGLQDVIQNRLKVSRHIMSVMKELVDGGSVSHEQIFRQYRLAEMYGARSLWYSNFFRKSRFLHEYYRMLVMGEGMRLSDLPSGEVMARRPLRTVEMRRSVNFYAGFPQIGDYVLSPLELELLLSCTAKKRFGQVIEELFIQYGSPFPGLDDFTAHIMEMMRAFENKHWVLFCLF